MVSGRTTSAPPNKPLHLTAAALRFFEVQTFAEPPQQVNGRVRRRKAPGVGTQFASKLNTLGFELPEWCLLPSEMLVREYEKRFELTLPSDYREFLIHHGGVIGNANCAFQEPTPCGTGTCIDSFYGFTWRIDMTMLLRRRNSLKMLDAVAIGDNLIGAMFWLKCSGKDSGNVYMHDHEALGVVRQDVLRVVPESSSDHQGLPRTSSARSIAQRSPKATNMFTG